MNAHMLISPSGGGKSTYVTQLITDNTFVVWPDYHRFLLTGDMSNQTMNHCIFAAALPIQIHTLSVLGRDIIYDATSVSRKARAPILKQLNELGYKVHGHVFRVPIDICQARNAARSRVIPAEVITRQFAQWQEPALDEGFASLTDVPYIPEVAIT